MRKISREYEHPLDNLFIDWAEKVSPLFKDLGMTPNNITFLSLVFGVLAIYCLYKDYILGFVIFYLISHWADCADGHFARKYKMTSKFGDYFDHIKDAVVFLGILSVFIFKFKSCLLWYDWVILGIIVGLTALGMARQLGCQEKHYSKIKGRTDESDTLSPYTKLCSTDDTEGEMRKRRWLGCANFILVIVFMVTVTFISVKCRREV